MNLISAIPAVINLALYQGDDFAVDITVTNPDGSAFNLAGYTPKSQIKDAPDGNLLATFTAAVDGTTINLIHLTLPSAQSSSLTSTLAYWDCQISGPKIITLCYGTVSVTLQVTI